jgi:hypothetical protein
VAKIRLRSCRRCSPTCCSSFRSTAMKQPARLRRPPHAPRE